MPRKRTTRVHARPKSKHYRCRSCGAIVPTVYECLCPESRFIARVYSMFPGTREIGK